MYRISREKLYKTGGRAAWPKTIKLVYVSMDPEMLQ
jgi:hypothetical protein